MKSLRNVGGLLLVGCLALSFASCSKDDDKTPAPLKVEDVNGSYTGKLITEQNKVKSENTIAFTADKNVITIADLPVKEIVTSIVKDAKKVETVLKDLGKVKYSLDYTAALSATKTSVSLTFAPKALEIQLPVDGAKKKVVVTFTAKAAGTYANDKTLKFVLTAEKVMVDDVVLTPYDVVTYDASVKK
jgi:hypothetical protein